MIELGVNIDHVATVRQARKTYEPDPVVAAALAEQGGADGITFHLREDRRHIQDRDVELLGNGATADHCDAHSGGRRRAAALLRHLLVLFAKGVAILGEMNL